MKTDLIYIYGLIDPITDELRYVGISVDPLTRLYDHVRKAKYRLETTYKGNWVISLLDKGVLPIMHILDIQPRAELEFWEQHYISYYKSIGCNLTNIALGGFHNHVSLETKEKISRTLKGRKLSPEHVAKYRGRIVSDNTRLKLSVALSGKVRSDETKLKMSLAAKGKPMSLEHRLALSKALTGLVRSDEVKIKMAINRVGKVNANKGRKLSKEHCEKISLGRKGKCAGDKNPFYGKQHDEETRMRISAAITGRTLSVDHKDKLCKAVVEFDLDGLVVREYKSIKDASEYHGIPHITISVNCRKNEVKKSVVQKTQTMFKFKDI